MVDRININVPNGDNEKIKCFTAIILIFIFSLFIVSASLNIAKCLSFPETSKRQQCPVIASVLTEAGGGLGLGAGGAGAGDGAGDGDGRRSGKQSVCF